MADQISRYKSMVTNGEVRKNIGYNYRGRLLLRSTDNNLYKNPKLKGFAIYMEDMLQFWMRQIKQIKSFVNYHVDKDDDSIN